MSWFVRAAILIFIVVGGGMLVMDRLGEDGGIRQSQQGSSSRTNTGPDFYTDPEIQFFSEALTPDWQGEQRELFNNDIVRSGAKIRILVTGKQGASISAYYKDVSGNEVLLTEESVIEDEQLVIPETVEAFEIESNTDGKAFFEVKYFENGYEIVKKVIGLNVLAHTDVSKYSIFLGESIATASSSGNADFSFLEDKVSLNKSVKLAELEVIEEAGALQTASRRTRGVKEQELYVSSVAKVAYLSTPEGSGSGSIISGDGLILTNYHVVRGYENIRVYLYPGEDQPLDRAGVQMGEVIKVDQVADLALVKLQPAASDLAIFILEDAENIVVGQDTHAIGHPRGQLWSYTVGYVNKISSQFEFGDAMEKNVADVIQNQTPINPGNSGGPLFNDDGKLIGINSFGASNEGSVSYEGMNYAVSVSEIARFLDRQVNRFSPGSHDGLSWDQWPTHEWRDIDGNGITDALLVDNDADGFVDTIFVDADEDEELDFVVSDRDANGKLDSIRSWREFDGVLIEIMEIDHDENGVPEFIWVDDDFDGTIDRYWKI